MNTYKMFFYLLMISSITELKQNLDRLSFIEAHHISKNPKTCYENSQIECEENSLIADS